MRVVKEAEIRKSEILDIAEELFNTKGYADTSISDILAKTGIARGTLYYHFASKEDILNAVIERHIDRCANQMQTAADSNLNVLDKFYKLIEIQMSSGTATEGLHNIENAQFHQRSFTMGLARYCPVYCQTIEEGIAQGVFSTPCPYETAELLLCASRITDPGIFTWTEEQFYKKAQAFVCLAERALGTKEGILNGLLPLFTQNGGN